MKKENYNEPQLEVVSIKVEAGFAATLTNQPDDWGNGNENWL